jgi:hypothetical protein
MPPEKTSLVTFKPTLWKTQLMKADRAWIRGDHLALVTQQGRLAALFVKEMVESWNEVQGEGRAIGRVPDSQTADGSPATAGNWTYVGSTLALSMR